MYRRLFGRSSLFVLAASPVLVASSARADGERAHRIAIHVGGGSPAEMNLALSNAVNAAEYYAKAGKTVAIEMVAMGPGYAMLREDVSPVKSRIAEIHQQFPFMVFSACQNSRRGVAKAEGKTIEQIVEIPEANDVPAGIVRLSELQEQGWSYLRA